MAFIVPVVRKDYNLFLAVGPQFPPKKSKTAGGGGVKNARLTKSLPLFPTTVKPAGGEIRRQCSAMNHSNLSKHHKSEAANTVLGVRPRSSTTVETGDKTSRRATYPLGDGQPMTGSGSVDCLPTQPEDISPADETRCQRVKASNDRGSAVSSPLDINLPADSGYPTSASGSPSSFTSDSPSTFAITSSTMSAPASPILNHRSSLRRSDASASSSTNSAEEDGREEGQHEPSGSGSPTVTTRHVHFGFCEQIEYECPLKWQTNQPSTKYGRLKRFEQKLAAQLKSKLMFRPRAYSMPLPHSGLLSRKSHIALKDERADQRLSVDDHLVGRPAEVPPV